ncbi:DUF2461 domain-containing protein [Maritalea sp.]|uniref:DUF2461 domain-containing protein n=1 Tax=Maritalea sp. TaxID=2003361 RepID=UPI003EFA41CD
MFAENIQSFLSELKENNNREWFEANKPRYQNDVVNPVLELIGTIEGELAALSPPLRAEPKANGSLRRIYRDTRFSKDKTPYHTHIHLIFWTGGHPNKSPGVHVVLHPEGFSFGAGHWALDNEQLDRMRQQILGDGGAAVSKVIMQVEQHGAKLDEPALARVPRGFDKDAPGADLLRHKGLVVKSGTVAYSHELENVDGAAKLILGICEKMAPLNKYLVEHVWSA